MSVKGCKHRAGHPDRRYPCPPRTAGHGAQPSSVCFPTVTPRCPDVCSSRVEPSPGNAPSMAGFAPAVPAAEASPDLLGQILLCGGWRRQPTDFHSGLVLVRGPKTPGFFSQGSLGSAGPGHGLLCAVQLLLLPWGAAKAAAPWCHGCASCARNSCLFNLLNYWQIPAANNPWLANALQTACGRRFALGGSLCVGCVRRVVEPTWGTCAGDRRLRDRLCGLKLSA